MSDTTTETTGQRRLRQAREALAAQRAKQAGAPSNAEEDAPRVLVPGETFHALADGLTIGRSSEPWSTLPAIITRRGETYTADEQMIAAAVNRRGEPGWTATVHDEAAQLRRWGRVYLAPGPAPEGMEAWTPGSPEWSIARERARADAHAQPTADERAAALAEVQRRFGDAPVTSVTLNAAPNPSIQAAAEQADRLAARAGGR
ncbi:hypothetical protein [Microbacterium sp. T32]|uniref:hypothetical protein n=1 Tax=Microbacterium sp. T32 TaxID=1776083 RepID=UPI0007AC13C4|nr:hypothetical protein [Microbacterium sp. T32]KZE41587.1 hypothetical protein AVW09_03105 [Microbacterium sp. T32]